MGDGQRLIPFELARLKALFKLEEENGRLREKIENLEQEIELLIRERDYRERAESE
jgi:cell division protein FtsB